MMKIQLKVSTWDFSDTHQLGQVGGFGAVYRCPGPEGEVAIKRLHIQARDAANREMKLASSLMSRMLKNVVPVLDHGLDQGSGAYFLVMPLCSGTLQQEIAARGPLDQVEAQAIALEILYGLREVSVIVHRDLKPSNVLKRGDGWCIADFGIAKFVEDSTSLVTLRDCLTPSYGAPEQWRNEKPTHATDVYSLGCIIYTMLAGAPPFAGAASLKEAHLKERPARIEGIDDTFSALIGRMLRKEMLARPTIDRCIETLESFRTRKPVVLHSPFARAAHAIVDRGADVEIERRQTFGDGERRLNLAKEAASELDEIRSRTRTQIALHAELVRASDGNRLSVGNGVLEIGAVELLPVHTEPVMFSREQEIRGPYRRSGWDALAFAPMRIEQRNYNRRGPRGVQYAWESLLFFGRHPKQSEYRWWEVAFYSLAEEPEHRRSGAVKPDDPGFDIALAGKLFVIQLAFGPVAIDAEDEQQARARWLAMLAEAAVSQFSRNRPPIPVTKQYLDSILSS